MQTNQLCVFLDNLNKTTLAPASVEPLHLSGARLLLLLSSLLDFADVDETDKQKQRIKKEYRRTK